MIKNISDKIGICVSTLCLIHCFATPVLLIAFPSISHDLLEGDIIHIIFGIMVILMALTAIIPNCRNHEHRDIFYIALTGASLIVFAIIFGHDLGDLVEHVITIAGSVILIIAHLKNMKVRHGKCSESVKECAHH